MFIVYSISNIAGTTNIKDSDFISADKNYLQAKEDKISVDRFLEYENLESVDYILPGSGVISFIMQIKDYYQVAENSNDGFTGTLMAIDSISNDDIIQGRMPENEKEIVIDKMVYDKAASIQYGSIANKGINSPEELLGRKVSAGCMEDLEIVGIVDKGNPSAYADRNIFINLINYIKDSVTYFYGSSGITSSSSSVETKVADYKLYLDDIKITKGRMPENDYEVIVNSANQYSMKLNKTIDAKVNGKELKVVGYYDSKTNMQTYLVNNNTVKYNVINSQTGIMVYPKNKAEVLDKFRNEYNVNLQDKYETEKEEYLKDQNDLIKGGVIFASIILIISLIEIYLMERSSFLSRIREVGVLRAIGAKKFDIYKMFIGEILAITTLISMPGLILMTYILSSLSSVPYVSEMFVVNARTIGMSIGLIYAFNIIVGLLPLFRVLRKTPAQILARHDID